MSAHNSDSEEMSDIESSNEEMDDVDCIYCGFYIYGDKYQCDCCSRDGSKFCAGCIHECEICGKTGCSGCCTVERCAECARNVCNEHSGACDECDRTNYCGTCLEIDACKNCRFMGEYHNAACKDCTKKCPDCAYNPSDGEDSNNTPSRSSCIQAKKAVKKRKSDIGRYAKFFTEFDSNKYDVEPFSNVVKIFQQGDSEERCLYNDPCRSLPGMGAWVVTTDCRGLLGHLGYIVGKSGRNFRVQVCFDNPNIYSKKAGTVETFEPYCVLAVYRRLNK